MASIKSITASILLFSALSTASVGQILAPSDDIVFAASASAKDPLAWAGANSPYRAGPNVYGISNEVPDGCSVKQAAYIVRHGSRFPDSGAYAGWVDLRNRIQAAKTAGNLTARGSLSFIPNWKTVLTNPTLQISQESMTGYNEGHNLGYQLRARYPNFYEDGNQFYVWANQYASPINESRVVQTAKAFMQGYLAEFADAYGTIVSVNSTGSVNAIGNSLGPSDACPAFAAGPSGSDFNNATDYEAIWTPKVLKRINSLVDGIEFTQSDILSMPYLCGFESQITGRLSPWCGVFTDEELEFYEYSQDLHYYYGIGPGSTTPTNKLFLPFLDSLITLLKAGPDQQGKGVNGTKFDIPKLLMAFLNDNQIAELTAGMGIFDAQENLPIDRILKDRIYNVANFITMRGTVTFEVLNCTSSSPIFEYDSELCASETYSDYIRILLNDAAYILPHCHDGPGGSCLLSEYASFISKRSAAAGNFNEYCNVTKAGHPVTVGGASFFSDLTLDFLEFVAPH
ncbi:histidine acid phosphatase, putative [Talaromyces stipitatus ATCC 10500]|uniref:3-phytase n=1 Tax=Talaromyces stipitatus (strain ATCC 10500 / CBS 375.48 / QM 6759 / NRRL 1006) TaxID=441959 RepID=B8MHA0_TALSN|nr:histidine acid phosphatase, putative [Talaromyces stipitatus ATCC 10500]EED17079.1 histidine acid phosphatase, putative [Talaromyces stipitatus ATCC 10500]